MPDYQQGKIYLIWSSTSMDVYIGSTCLPLNKRLSCHKSHSNSIAKKIIDLENAEIELIEMYPCNNKRELEERERLYIENALYSVNTLIPCRTRSEYYQDNKEYFTKLQKMRRAKKKLTPS